MADLIADKRLTYAGRVYRPGVGFSAPSYHARVLVAAGMARFAPTDGQPVPARETAATVLGRLRTEYETKFGRAPDMRWGAKRLAKEVATQ
jgi:hypothetical protein